MSHYFVFSDNRVSEPLGLEELRDKVIAGDVTEQHMISVDGGNWVAAREIQDLFPIPKVVASEIMPPPPTPITYRQPPSPPPTAVPQIGWFYAKDGQAVGPMPEEVIKELARKSVISAGDFVWTTGQSGAVPAIHVPVLTEIFRDAAKTIPAPAYSFMGSSVQSLQNIPATLHSGFQRPNNEFSPISNQGVIWTFWVTSILGVASVIATLYFRDGQPEAAMFIAISAIAFLISVILFTVFYAQALYRCWNKLYLAGDTRWPSPAWVVVIFVGTGLLTIIPSPITTLLYAVGMVFTNVWLGLRINAILDRTTRTGEKPRRSATTGLGYSLIVVSVIGGLWVLGSPPESIVFRALVASLVIMNMAYHFIQAAVADVNRFRLPLEYEGIYSYVQDKSAK